MNKQRRFLKHKATQLDTIVMDTCHHTFVQTHRMYDTKK